MQQGRADLALSQRQGKGRFRTAAILEEQIRSLQQLQRAATNYCIFKTQTWISQAHHACRDDQGNTSRQLDRCFTSQVEADEMEQHMNRNAQLTVQEELRGVYQPLQDEGTTREEKSN